MVVFLGNIITTDYSKWIYGIVWALAGYLIGAACSVIVAFMAYLSQSEYNNVYNKRNNNQNNDNINNKGDSPENALRINFEFLVILNCPPHLPWLWKKVPSPLERLSFCILGIV